MQENNYDIFAVSESWLNSTIRNADLEIEGYKLSRLNRLRNQGEACVFIKLKVNVLKELTGISLSGSDQLWLKIQHKKIKSFLLCVLTYRPPDSPVSHFVDEFTDTYSQALVYGKDVLVVGDLNCDLLKCFLWIKNCVLCSRIKFCVSRIEFSALHLWATVAWCCQNILLIDPDKTKFLLLHHRCLTEYQKVFVSPF